MSRIPALLPSDGSRHYFQTSANERAQIAMRIFCVTTAVVLMTFFVASTASAFEFTAISNAPATIDVGDIFTIDIELKNASGDAINAFDGGILSGLSGFEVVSGQSASAYFVGLCSPSACIGGLDTIDNHFFNPKDLSTSGAYSPGDAGIKLVSALALSPTSANGAIDPGLIGPPNAPSALDATIVLRAVAPGLHDLVFGFELVISGQVVNSPTQTLALTVFGDPIPEPEATLPMIDPGLDGSLTEPSASDTTIVPGVDVPASGPRVVRVGVSVIGGLVFLDSISGNALFSFNMMPTGAGNMMPTGAVHVIPEPGTALLMGLGLAGLTTAGRRRK
jgi:hypothetical protein